MVLFSYFLLKNRYEAGKKTRKDQSRKRGKKDKLTSTNLQTTYLEQQVEVHYQVLTRGYSRVLVNSHLSFYGLIYPVLLLL
jgi:hypothetical protein